MANNNTKINPVTGKQIRGFATMAPELRSQLARKGGQTAHAIGRAHQFTSEEARVAGSKGGRATSANRQARMAANINDRPTAPVLPVLP